MNSNNDSTSDTDVDETDDDWETMKSPSIILDYEEDPSPVKANTDIVSKPASPVELPILGNLQPAVLDIQSPVLKTKLTSKKVKKTREKLQRIVDYKPVTITAYGGLDVDDSLMDEACTSVTTTKAIETVQKLNILCL